MSEDEESPPPKKMVVDIETMDLGITPKEPVNKKRKGKGR